MTDDPWAAFRSQKETSDDPWASFRSTPTAQTPQEKTDALSGTERYARGATYGLLSGAEGAVNTLGKTVEGADPQKLAKLQSLISAVKERMGVSPDQYAPASQAAQDPNATLGQRLSNVPRSVVEMAGPAIVGGMVGGLPGAVAATTASTAGPAIDRKREALGLTQGQELPDDAKRSIAAKLGFDAVALGLGGNITRGLMGPIESTGVKALTETGKHGLIAAGADAALGSSATAVDKLAIENQRPSISDLTVGAAQGGLPGLVAHSPGIATKVPGAVSEASLAAGKAVRDPVVNRTFSSLESLDPQSRGRAADLIQKFSGNMDAAEDILKKDITRASKGLDDIIKEKIDEVKTAYDRKVPINPEWIDAIKEADPITGRAVEDLTTFAAMRDLQDNALYTKVKDINPLTNFKSRITDYAIGHLFSPTLAKAIAAGETAIAGAAYGVDKFTGLSDPAKVIMDKYAGTADPAQTIAQARAAARAQAIAQNDFRKTADLHNAYLEQTDALNEKQALDSKEQLRAIADREAKAESNALWKTALESLRARRNADQIKANDLEAKVSSFQDKAIGSLDRLDKTVASEQLAEQKANQLADTNFWKQQRERLAIRAKSDIPASEYLGQNLGVNQNVPLPELVSSNTSLALKTANLRKYLKNNEKARQDALLKDIPRQLKLRENSESASSSPTALALSVAKLKRDAMENAERQGPTAPPTSTPVSARPELVKTNMKLEEIKRKAEAKRQKEADKQKSIAAKAKADKRVKDATKKIEQSKEDVETSGVVVRHRGQKIVIPEGSEVRKIKNYKQSFIEKTDRRMDVIDAAKKLTKDEQVHERLDQLAQDWTDTTDNSQAHRVVENLINDVINDSSTPKNVAAYLKKNMHKVKNTWTNLDPVQTQVSNND